MLVLAGGTVLGVLATLAAGQEPGGLLGFFVIVGTIAAALSIRRGKVYLLFPAPALAFFVGAIVTGKVHDSQLGSSTAGLGAGFAQWVAGIFFPAVIATIIVVLMGLARWLLGRQLVTGQFNVSTGRPPAGGARPAAGARRPAVDEWADDNPFDDVTPREPQTGPRSRPGTGPSPRPGTGPRPSGSDRPRQPRDQRADRDQWGDPRPRPGGQGAKPSTGARPSFNPNRPANPNRSSPPRPPRRQPPEGWNQR